MLEGAKGNRKIVMLTAYDYQMARLVEQAGIDLLLVGDSLGMVVLGYPTTKQVTMEEMLHHTKAVARGARATPVIGDMPIGSYSTPQLAVENAKRFLEAGAKGVKIEGCDEEVVRALLSENIPVMGHLGLLPQTAEKHKLVGKNEAEAERIFQDALSLDRLGVFSIVLECIPEKLAKRITENVKAVTIGIGAGKYCDGQVLVINDLLGMDETFKPKFVKRYANLAEIIREAVSQFKKEVEEGSFPDEEHSYH